MTDVNQLKTMQHKTIIDLVNAFIPLKPLRPSAYQAGVCNGFTSMWIQAVSTGLKEEADFYHRLDGLSSYLLQPNASMITLKNQVNALYTSQKKSSSALRTTLTKQDLWLIEMHAFAESIALQQAPYTLGIFPETVFQQNKKILYPLTASTALQRQGLTLKEDRIGSVATDRIALKCYFNEIKAALQKEYKNNPTDKKISFLLGSGFHSIGFYLNLKTGQWHYMDINKLSGKTHYYFSANSASLTDLLFQSLSEKHPHAIFTLSCISTWHSEALVTALREINQSFLAQSLSKINHLGNNALDLSILYGEPAVVKTLLEAGEKINSVGAYNPTILMYAAIQGDVRIVETVLDTKRKRQSLFSSAQYALEFCTNLLVDNLNRVDENGKSALMLAAQDGFTEVVKFLIHRGANVTIQNKDGFNALMLAAQFGHAATVKTLIETKKESFPSNLLTLMLSAQHEVDAVNNNGNTALMLAAQHGRQDVVAFLISKKADINRQNYQGNSALIFAKKNNHMLIADLLIHAGAVEYKSWGAWLKEGLFSFKAESCAVSEPSRKRARI